MRAGYFTGAGFHAVAPAGAILDKLVIWRHGYRFNSTGTAQGPWVIGGFRGDSTVIGGPLTGETDRVPLVRIGVEHPLDQHLVPGA